MPDIGIIPTRTSIQLREPDGDAGTIPAATPSSAGCMTADQARQLQELYTWHRTHAGTGAPVIIETQADTSNYVDRLELRAMLQQLPRALDTTPQIAALRSQVESLSRMIGDESRILLPAPKSDDTVDRTARGIIEAVITNFEALEQRVRVVEHVIDTLKAVAEYKAGEAARAA